MSEMVNRVASSISAAEIYGAGNGTFFELLLEANAERGCGFYPALEEETRDEIRIIARAAIQAMREPTLQMVCQTAVWVADPTDEQIAIGTAAVEAMAEGHPFALMAGCEIVRDWQTMIDQALQDKA